MPFELCSSPSIKIDPWQDPHKVSSWDSFILPTAKALGIQMRLPRISPHPYTHLVFEGYQFAKEHGKGNEFFHRVFTAFFQEELNIEDVEILTKLAGEVGLSMESFREALVSRTYGKLHQEVLRHAYERAQITAVPTLIIGDTVIQGLASKERLAQAIDQEAAKAKHNRFDGMQCGIDGNC